MARSHTRAVPSQEAEPSSSSASSCRLVTAPVCPTSWRVTSSSCPTAPRPRSRAGASSSSVPSSPPLATPPPGSGSSERTAASRCGWTVQQLSVSDTVAAPPACSPHSRRLIRPSSNPISSCPRPRRSCGAARAVTDAAAQPGGRRPGAGAAVALPEATSKSVTDSPTAAASQPSRFRGDLPPTASARTSPPPPPGGEASRRRPPASHSPVRIQACPSALTNAAFELSARCSDLGC